VCVDLALRSVCLFLDEGVSLSVCVYVCLSLYVFVSQSVRAVQSWASLMIRPVQMMDSTVRNGSVVMSVMWVLRQWKG